MKKYILSIDAGTTGITVLLFDNQAQIISSEYSEFKQYYPKPGWVEHDPIEIWETTLKLIINTTNKVGSSSISAIGITNQRETTVLWDKTNSKPIYNAIVWQCRRTSDICNKLIEKKYNDIFKSKTGLVIDSYFSGTKINWILNNVKNAKKIAKNGNLAFGTIDSWLIWNLTNTKNHVTDHTNASRTLIYNINNQKWDKELLDILKIPASILPKINKSSGNFGITDKDIIGSNIPITAVMGDQQSALYGQLGFDTGSSKCTYGTGCFILTNIGKKRIDSNNGLITTIACDAYGNPTYAIEGSVFIGGAVIQWLRDELRIIKNAQETNKIAQSMDTTNGVYIVPAFTGLGAPYWDMDAKGTITGITRGTTRDDLIRASLESIAYQVYDLLSCIENDINEPLPFLNVDGGATENNFLMQFQSDILNKSIKRPEIIETTALGVALLSGLSVGIWESPEEFKKMIKINRCFSPNLKKEQRKLLLSGWRNSIKMTLTERKINAHI